MDAATTVPVEISDWKLAPFALGGETVFAHGRPTRLDVGEAAGILMESQARALRNAKDRDYLGRDGESITPLSLGWMP